MGDPPGALPQSKALGLNNKAEVVGISSISSSSVTHALIWPYNQSYAVGSGPTTLGAKTTFDLNTLFGLAGSHQTMAHDINLCSQIAGSVPKSFGIPRAFVWDLANNSTTAFGALVSTGDSYAFAINDDNPPVVVGTSESSGGTSPIYRGFRTTLTSAPTLTGLTSLGALYECQAAFEINVAGTVTIAGGPSSSPPGNLGFGCDRLDPNMCPNFDADGSGVHWQGTSIAATLAFLPDPTDHVALGINNANQTVGWGLTDPDDTCTRRAVFWSSPTASAFNLGTVSGVASGAATFANAINNPTSGTLQVVGGDESNDVAMLWTGSGTSWTAYDLNNQLLNACGWDTLIEATDVNDAGYIVGYGLRDNDEIHAFLLVPVKDGCIGDMNGDCRIDGLDLAIVYGFWDTNQGAPCRPGDLNFDGKVTGLDIAILLGSWSPDDPCDEGCIALSTTTCGEESSSSSSSGWPEGGPSLAELVEILTELGFGELADLLESIWPSE